METEPKGDQEEEEVAKEGEPREESQQQQQKGQKKAGEKKRNRKQEPRRKPDKVNTCRHAAASGRRPALTYDPLLHLLPEDLELLELHLARVVRLPF